MDYLGGLASCDVVVGAEVGTVVGGHARHAGAAAWVAVDDVSVVQAAYIIVEGRAGSNVLEDRVRNWVSPVEDVSHHLR